MQEFCESNIEALESRMLSYRKEHPGTPLPSGWESLAQSIATRKIDLENPDPNGAVESTNGS